MKKHSISPWGLTLSPKHISTRKVLAGTALLLAVVGMTGCTESTNSNANAGNNSPAVSQADTSAADANDPDNADTSASDNTDTTTDTNETSSESNDSAESSSYGVGETAESGDVQVTFLGVTESAGSEFNEPGDGNVFLLAEFEIANNGQEDLSISSMLSFDAYQDGYATEVSLSALMEADSQLDGNVAPGKKMKGVVGYEVPAEYKELEINMQLDVWSDDKLVFVYNK